MAVNSLSRALALWTTSGERTKFSLAGHEVRPHSSDSLQEFIYVWVQDNGTQAVRMALSADIAEAMQWWADGAELDGKPLDLRAGFKAIEFLVGLSAAVPAGLDNAGPLLSVLRSPRFKALPDRELGDVPLKSALLTLAISALGSWVLSDQFELSKYSDSERAKATELIQYVSQLPVDAHDAIVCFAAVLRVCPDALTVALSNGLKSRLPTYSTVKADADSYNAVRALLSEAAQNYPAQIPAALKSAGHAGYVEMLDLTEPAKLVQGWIMNVGMKAGSRKPFLKSLLSRTHLNEYAGA